jgi:HSP20 family protein
MSIMRWDPFGEMSNLREEMNRVFGDFFSKRRLPDVTREVIWSPAIDVFETEGELVVKAMLPGMKKEDIDLTFTDDNILTIKGEVKAEIEDKKRNYYHRELVYGQFVRTIGIPQNVKTDETHAEFADGILVIRIPKAEAEKPKVQKIEVK